MVAGPKLSALCPNTILAVTALDRRRATVRRMLHVNPQHVDIQYEAVHLPRSIREAGPEHNQ